MPRKTVLSIALDRAPYDRAFSLAECYRWCIEAGLDVRRKSVRMALWRACQRGEIDRVTHAHPGQQATYSRPGVNVPIKKTLVEWAEIVQTKSCHELRPLEILVRMVERGYVLNCSRKDAVRHLARAMDISERSECEDRKLMLGKELRARR